MAPKESGWTEVEGVEATEFGEFYKWGPIGDVVEGVYENRRINPARDDRNTGERFKQQNLYDIRGDAGDLWTLNGNTDLDGKMRKVRIGSRVRIILTEEREIKPGLNPARIFSVSHRPNAETKGAKSE